MGEECLDYLLITDHNGPVFSTLFDAEVVSFLWVVGLGLHNVSVAEKGPGRGQSRREVRHCVVNSGY